MNEQQELEFKIGEGEEPVDIDMGEDGQSPKIQEGEQAPHVETSGGNAEKPDSELNQYSENVKKRIDKLTARLRETQRREEAAITYARNVQAEAQQMQQRMFRTDEERLHEAKGRIDTQVVALKQIIRKAREEGDIDTETEAQQRLADLTYEQRQVAEENQRRETYVRQQAAAPQQQQYSPQAQQAPAQQYQQPAPVDPKLEDWMEKNPWYGQDTVMTNTAWGIHKQLVINEGFDGSSDEYYDELDKRMRGTYPRKFSPQAQNNSATRNVQSVAPATRSSGVNSSARRTVRLSPSQVAMAKKLGVPLEEYAKYVKE
jgi:hypothetical protein